MIEFIIGMVLMTIISGIMVLVLNTSFGAIDRVQSRKTISLDGSSSVNKFIREFGQLADNQSLQLADSKKIRFSNNQGLTIEYELSNGNLYRKVIGQGQAQVLTIHVDMSTSSFGYFEKNNSELTNVPLSASDREKVWMVELVLNMVSGDQIVPYLADVFPENLKLEETVEGGEGLGAPPPPPPGF